VVVADDDRDMRDALAAALRRDGYDVVELADGADVLDYMGNCLLHKPPDPPDLLIADIRMPGFSGLQVTAGLRKIDVPIILITGFGDATIHAHAERLGAVAVFDKPFEVDDLRTLVCNLVTPEPSSAPAE